ncbi:hypothetical protein [Sediminibacterium sp.]|uniref:ORC-CDC6 family AAA ATPase n=1 Tax=Sediminibacterium sp. TaxID=1917865 RepID=UPI00273525BC|nr:hypothetical protein [Sediminibacterium sp.]MDP3392537.1 hypothetical protein [Sediminibacterium sp.]MDP3565803.1 hypothetical protein [Sediminibacterium sp.]
MRIDKNPFVTRTSEYIDMEEKFIQLFSADILQLFKDDELWNKVNVLRSSPGGGKTTLLKLFTPKVLHAITLNKNHNEHVKEVFLELKSRGVFDRQERINVVGTYISFNTQFSTFEYLPFPAGQQLRIFFSLVNVRSILSFLKSLCLVKDFQYPQQLDRISFGDTTLPSMPSPLHMLSKGYELYSWAIAQEEKIFDAVDSINLKDVEQLTGSDDLYALDFLAAANIRVDGEPIKEKVLVMFDDVQNLSRSQRNHLVKTIVDKRPLVNTWIAERLRALTMEELLSEGQIEQRDLRIIELEKFWSRRYQQFEKFAKSVANRRLESAFPDQQYDFSSFLMSSMGHGNTVKIEKALTTVKERIKEKFGKQEQYKAWISQKEELQGEPFHLLIEWRTLEIILHRESNQANLFDFTELSEDQLQEQEGNEEKVAAQLFVYREFGIPFYYGFELVARLSSSNIEQFLTIASALFEEIRSNSIKKVLRSQTTLHITPEKQQQIIQKLAGEKWKALDKRVHEFNDIKRLLDAIGELCRSETYVPNAWNAPGINGIAITMAERNLLKDYALKDNTHIYHYLARCLVLCISYNLIDIKLNYRCKGKDLMIIYLNRLYCAKYELPLHNGRFKERNLGILAGYLTKGFQGQIKMKM